MVRKLLNFTLMIVGLVAVNACGVTVGTGDTYDWSGLYFEEIALNRGQSTLAEYKNNLQELVDEVEEPNSHELPPGLYAQLGLAWFELGEKDKAIFYLKKEATLWPECTSCLKLVQDIENDKLVYQSLGSLNALKQQQEQEAKAKQKELSSQNLVSGGFVDMKPSTRK